MADNLPMLNSTPASATLRQWALKAFLEPDAWKKSARALAEPELTADELAAFELPARLAFAPGRPLRPALTSPARVPRRSPATLEGRAALVHAICHIEFNAINLALDAAWRFDGMPDHFYADWAQVAREEAQHFTLLRKHLRGMSAGPDGGPRWDYGDFPAHDGLWEMCGKTADDVLARMALVPRTLEARGLDATPQIQAKLRQVGTPDSLAAVAILDIILRDEVGHVAIGNHWYRYLCNQRQLDPVATYAELAQRYRAPPLRRPFNVEARLRAGFTPVEMQVLAAVADPAS